MPKYLLLLSIFLYTSVNVTSQNYFETIPFLDSMNITEMAFNNQGDIFVSANFANNPSPKNGIYRSTDLGQTWYKVLQIGPIQSRGICIDSDGDIYALADWGEEGTLYKSTDNGQTWNSNYIPISIYWFNLEIFSKGNDTLFVSQSGGSPLRLLRSFDDGLNWDTVFYKPITGTEYITDVAIGDHGEVFMATSSWTIGEGALYKSTDYGSTWNLFSVEGNMIYDLCYNSLGDLFFTVMDGVYAGGLYAVYKGDQIISPIVQGFGMMSVVSNSSDDLFAGVFEGGYVYHTADNGNTFDWITSNSYSILNMFIDSSQYIYTTSYGSSIWRSVQSTITSSGMLVNNEISIFPNPCTETISVCSDKSLSGKISYEIFDIKGSPILRGQLTSPNGYIRINVSDLVPGIYCLKLISSGYYTTRFSKF